jgi:hypothetical protein
VASISTVAMASISSVVDNRPIPHTDVTAEHDEDP